MSVHSRRAVRPVLDLLGERGAGIALLHWFAGTRPELRRAVSMGCWFSVGSAMLKSAKGRELVAEMPRDRIVLESDGPFVLAKGRPVEPTDVRTSLNALADLWGAEMEDASSILRSNEGRLIRSADSLAQGVRAGWSD